MSVQTMKVDKIALFLVERGSDDPDPKSPLGTLELTETLQIIGSKTKILSQRWEWDKAPAGEQSGEFVWERTRGVPFIGCLNTFRNVVVVDLTRWKAGSPRPPLRPWFMAGDRIVGHFVRGSDGEETRIAGKLIEAAS